MEMRVMDSATAAGLLGVTERAIRKQISQGKLKTEAMRGSKGGGNCGMSNIIPVSEVLQQLDTQGGFSGTKARAGYPPKFLPQTLRHTRKPSARKG